VFCGVASKQNKNEIPLIYSKNSKKKKKRARLIVIHAMHRYT